MDWIFRKIKGTSVMESLVAMFIILLSLTLAGGIYTSLANGKQGIRSLLFQQECERIFLRNRHLATDNGRAAEQLSGYVFEQVISDYNHSPCLKRFCVLVRDAKENRKVFEYNRLYMDDEKSLANETDK